MNKIPESELILNADGSIYHLKLRPENIADDIIIVGDPNRVKAVSKYFSHIKYQIENREFITHTGYFNNKKITVMSTGIGTDNIDIAINELDALVNIDLENRIEKKNKKALNIIRIGTSGALQKSIPVDSFVLSEFGLGFDGLLNYYKCDTILQQSITDSFIQHLGIKDTIAKPYIVRSSELLSTLFGEEITRGITATASGFYGPQGRILRLPLAYPEFNDKISSFAYNNFKITNFEMETSALYGLAKLLGHHACTICLIIANRMAGTYSKDYKKGIDRLILMVLQKLTANR